MTWSYSGDPSNSDLDKVRFLIGDTDQTDQQLQNEEINYLVSSEGSVNDAAIKACYTLAAKYSRQIDQKVGQVDYKCSQRIKSYLELAKRLEDQISDQPVAPYAGGISKSDKETNRLDDDRVKPKFTKELHSVKPYWPDDYDDDYNCGN